MTDAEFQSLVNAHICQVITTRTVLQVVRTAKQASTPPHRHIPRIAAEYTATVRKAVQRAMQSGKVRASFITTSSDMTEKTFEPAIITTELELARTLPPLLQDCFNAGGQAAMDVLSKQLKLKANALRTAAYTKVKFNVADPDAVQWAMDHSAELVTDISETTRERIRQSIVDGLSTSMSVDDIANEIDDVLEDPDRADTIARHETMTAANEGQREGWSQAVDDGYLTGDEQRVWMASAKSCDRCANLDGTTTDLDGTYDDEGDAVDGPPLHVNCECTEGLEVEAVS